jgi:ferredoxin-NADP reductase
VARTAVLGRLSWRAGSLIAFRDETATARSLVFEVPGWPGHVAGQHVDVRLTAADGYTAVRSYSLANAAEGDRVELTIEQLPDGEVSPYLAREMMIGDRVELRGPIGGWFVWRPEQTELVQLIAGGSGIVPLMAMVRVHATTPNRASFRLLYSVRRPEAVLYAAELQTRAATEDTLNVTYVYTRVAPEGWGRSPRRIDGDTIAEATWPPSAAPTSYVCGPTPFVESVADLLAAAGHDSARIKTERFGPTGGMR